MDNAESVHSSLLGQRDTKEQDLFSAEELAGSLLALDEALQAKPDFKRETSFGQRSSELTVWMDRLDYY